MIMKRIIIVSIIFCIFFFTGCNKNNQTSETITLNVYTSFGESDGNHDTYQALIKQFQEKSNIVIEDHSAVSNEEWKMSILSLFNSGKDPDVLFYFSGTDAESLITEHKVIDLATIRESYPSYGTNINSSILDTMKASDSKNYALPVSGYWEGLFINKDLFDEYDISIPDNWDSFLEAISAFKEHDVIPIAVSLGEVPHYWFEFLIYNHTGPASHLNTIPTLNNPTPKAFVDGFNDLITLYQMGAFPPDTAMISNVEAFTLFQNKKAAMVLDGSWSVGQIQDTDNVMLIPFPTYENSPRQNTDMIAGFSMGFYITEKAWNDPLKQKACIDFINTMTSNDSIFMFNKNGTISPVSAKPHTTANSLLQSIALVNSEGTAFISAVQDTMNISARNTLFSRIPDIVSGAISIEDALNEFVNNNYKQ